MIRTCFFAVAGLLWLSAVSCSATAAELADKNSLAAASQTISPVERLKTITAQREWWNAYVHADTLQLRKQTTPDFSLTLNSGETFDRQTMLAQAEKRTRGKDIQINWSGETSRLLGPNVALVSSRVSDGDTTGIFRYLTVLQKIGGDWRVAAAQSTRELSPTPRVAFPIAGPLDDYVGDYMTPQGRVLRVVARSSRLRLVEPSGAEIHLEPIGPGLFEFDRLSPSNGQVRMLFTRDSSGKVTALNRLIVGAVSTFPRVR